MGEQKLNDPHVEALIYRIEPHSTVSYDDATPIVYELTEFRVKVNDGSVRFELKEHYATARNERGLLFGNLLSSGNSGHRSNMDRGSFAYASRNPYPR